MLGKDFCSSFCSRIAQISPRGRKLRRIGNMSTRDKRTAMGLNIRHKSIRNRLRTTLWNWPTAQVTRHREHKSHTR